MNTSDSRKNKWIAGGAILVMMLAGGSMLRIRSLQRKASPSDAEAQGKAIEAAVDARLALSPTEQARRLELVKHLRDVWKIWAEKHQPELRRMLNAKPSDVAARDAVWNAVPYGPFLSKNPSDTRLYRALNVQGNGAKGEVFNWNPSSKLNITRNSRGGMLSIEDQDKIRRMMASSKLDLQNDFAERRDIIISQSLQIGKVSVSLWASGRITEDVVTDKHLKSLEGFGVSTYKRKELIPPYEFLNHN